MSNKTLILVRGLPGSGKTTIAKLIASLDLARTRIFAADDFFYDEQGVYTFDVDMLHRAHLECQSRTARALLDSALDNIVVHNTFTTEKELKPYLNMASDVQANVISLIVENRHGNESVHNVPEETMEKMKNRFSVKI